MKKLLALLLIFSLALTLLCSCKKGQTPSGGNDSSSNDEEAAQETTVDITTLDNYYQDLSEPEIVADRLTYKLYQAWWEEDCLVLQLYFINGHTAAVTDLFIEELIVYNEGSPSEGDPDEEGYEEWNPDEGGMIASAAIGPVDETLKPIEPNTYTLVTLYLSGSCLEYPNADLSTLSVDFEPSYTW